MIIVECTILHIIIIEGPVENCIIPLINNKQLKYMTKGFEVCFNILYSHTMCALKSKYSQLNFRSIVIILIFITF